MKLASGRIVPLGYGKYVRSERVVGFAPIEEGRGPGRRTRVWVEGVPEPFVASRSETAILSDMAEGVEDAGQAAAQRQLLVDLLETVEELDPVVRRIVHDQGQWDLGQLERRIRSVLGLV